MVIANDALAERIEHDRLIAIIRGTDIDATVAAAAVLFENGVRVLEVPLTLAGAEEAIAQIVAGAPRDALVGAGTVLTAEAVDRSLAAGARFIVTPTLAPSVAYATTNGIGTLAGTYTPTEIAQAMDLGVAAAKLFPASTLGPGFIRAVSDPFPNARIIPVGGVSLETIDPFLTAGAFGLGVGGPLVGDAGHVGGDLVALAERARAYVAAVTR